MAQVPTNDALGFLASRPATPASALVLRFAVVLVKWAERRQTRRALSRLDPHLLDDVGLTPGKAAYESRRRFWQD